MKKASAKKPGKKGGDAIADGGYGCVFSPRLKCGGDDCEGSCGPASPAKDFISKLMENGEAGREYEEMTKFKEILDPIPKSQDYFIVDDVSICTPNSTDINRNVEDSMYGYPTCNYFRDVIDKPENYKIINMLNGGPELKQYYEKTRSLTYDGIKLVVNKLIDLLNFAVIPMNKRHLYHFDIKSANVLLDITKDKIRLIDWGLAHIITNTTSPDGIPSNHPWGLQFNIPYGSVFFISHFKDEYVQFLKDERKKNPYKVKDELCKEYLTEYLAILGDPKDNKLWHEDYIIYLYQTVKANYNKPSPPPSTPYQFVKKFLLQTLIKFTNETNENTFEFNWNDFLTMYYHNVDIWGTLTCLIPLVQGNYHNEIKEKVAEILMKYCYLNPIKPININDLNRDLNRLTGIAEKLKLGWGGGKKTRKRRHKRKKTKRKKMKKKRSRKHRSR